MVLEAKGKAFKLKMLPVRFHKSLHLFPGSSFSSHPRVLIPFNEDSTLPSSDLMTFHSPHLLTPSQGSTYFHTESWERPYMQLLACLCTCMLLFPIADTKLYKIKKYFRVSTPSLPVDHSSSSSELALHNSIFSLKQILSQHQY